jgi:hypothetical protein
MSKQNEDANLSHQSKDSALEKMLLPSIVGTVAGVATFIGLTNPAIAIPAAVVGTGIQTVLDKNFKTFIQYFNKKAEAVDPDNFDEEVIRSEQFTMHAFQAVEAASRTASESKLRALANALLSSVVKPTSEFKGKEAFIRLVAQMSEEEILALAVLCQFEEEIPQAARGEGIRDSDRLLSGLTVEDLAQKIGWNLMDTGVAYEGLFQLGLVLDAMTGSYGHFGNQHRNWQTTLLGKRVQKYSLEWAEAVSVRKSD